MSAVGRVAIVGSGIAGLAAAHRLRGQAQITLFEAGDHFGGHAHTVDVTLPAANGAGWQRFGVDTGFLVFNERTYPGLIALLAELGVATARSEMSFSVQSETAPGAGVLEWSGSDLNSVFAQRGNLLRPRFWGMLRDLLRFNRLCTALAASGSAVALRQSLGSFLTEHGFGEAFRQWYLLPMLGCIWSCPTDQMLRFPVATLIRFCHNHGLLQISRRPAWHTVQGGSRHYVDKIVAAIPDKRLHCPVRRIERDGSGVRLLTDHGDERFDALLLATHSDQALALLAAPTALESATLAAIRYQPNRVVLHTDSSLLPRRRRAWAAWNYQHMAGRDAGTRQVCLHYWINRLQPLPVAQPVLVSLNPLRPIARQQVLAEFDVAHPLFDQAALTAQQQVAQLQGRQQTWFAGAWAGYGFHEDGLQSGLAAAQDLLAHSRARAAQPDHADAGMRLSA